MNSIETERRLYNQGLNFFDLLLLSSSLVTPAILNHSNIATVALAKLKVIRVGNVSNRQDSLSMLEHIVQLRT